MFHFSNNITNDINSYEREQEKTDNMIICAECGEPIYEDYGYEIGDEIYCEACIESHRKRIY